jgi:hypothetical protein
MSLVMKAIKSHECEVLEQTFEPETIKTVVKVKVRRSFEENLLKDLKGSQGIEITSDL